MYFVRRNTLADLKSICAFIRLYSLGRKTHYEVLNLRKNCTDKEIKEAFIQMSKEYHPDKNKDVKAQEHFVRIVEAYNVLGKPSSRAHYDITTEIETNTNTDTSYVYKTHDPYNLYNNPQYSYFYEQNNPKTENTKNINNNYYGVAGLKKMPNYVIIMMCIGVALVGLIVQMFVIRESFITHQHKVQEKTKRLCEELERVRATARDNGNEIQTRILLEKIVTAANPTVATASLGQELATEKKESETLLTEFGVSEISEDWSYDSFSNMKVTYELLRKLITIVLS